jgi:transcriptional regulator with XRE-family HTH domain
MKLIGINIKRLREERNLTLRAMAKQSGVSASFLSQVETGKVSPSLATLKNISDVLSTTISKLAGENNVTKDDPIVRVDSRKQAKQIGKGVNLYLLTSQDENKQMEPLLFKLEEKATSGDCAYRHFGQEFVLVLRGTVEIILNETAYVLRKGDSIYFNSNVPHSFKNIGNREAEAVWVITPPTF